MKNLLSYLEKNNMLFGTLAATLLVASTVWFFAISFNHQITVEAGTTLNGDLFWRSELKPETILIGKIDSEKVGTYSCKVKILETVTVPVTIQIEDTKNPILYTKDLELEYGKTCEAKDFIVLCNDASDVRYEFVKTPDFKKNGDQIIMIRGTDSQGNSTETAVKLNIKGTLKEYYMEAGGPIPSASEFVVNKAIQAEYVTEPTRDMLSTAGSHKIPILFDGVEDEVIIYVTDKTAPVISTSVIKVTVNGSISYKKNISITDNCDKAEDIKLEIDNSKVNLSAVGDYKITCKATDKSGNEATKDITVQVVEATVEIYTQEQVNKLCDQVLAQIVNDSMTTKQKAEAIYRWTRNNIGYVNNSVKGDWMQGAYNGIVKRYGDCFTYAATAKALLERIGLQPIVVTKEKTEWTSQNNHFWLILNLGDGYYHYDPTPRQDGTYFFMWTDAKIKEYSDAHRGSHNFTRSKYPEIK